MPRDLIAVTGADGYLGGRIVRHLAAHGTPVRAVLRHRRPWLDVDLVEQVEAEAHDIGEPSAVIHLAAPNEVEAAADPAGTTASAVETVARVAERAVAAGTERFVLASTMHVYGARIVDGALLTEDLRCEPRHPYAVARLAAEHLTATILTASDSELAVLRFTNGVGAPADAAVNRWTLLVNELARMAVTERKLVLRTPGLQWRDFIAVTDICAVVEAACAPDRLTAGTYNVGSGIPRTVREVADMVADAVEMVTGTRPPVIAPSTTEPPPEPYHVDVSRLNDSKVIDRATPLEAAIAETVESCVRAFS